MSLGDNKHKMHASISIPECRPVSSEDVHKRRLASTTRTHDSRQMTRHEPARNTLQDRLETCTHMASEVRTYCNVYQTTQNKQCIIVNDIHDVIHLQDRPTTIQQKDSSQPTLFSANDTASSTIGYRHDTVVSLSVCPSVKVTLWLNDTFYGRCLDN